MKTHQFYIQLRKFSYIFILLSFFGTWTKVNYEISKSSKSIIKQVAAKVSARAK